MSPCHLVILSKLRSAQPILHLLRRRLAHRAQVDDRLAVEDQQRFLVDIKLNLQRELEITAAIDQPASNVLFRQPFDGRLQIGVKLGIPGD